MGDLHVHSTSSDGSTPPAELPALGVAARLSAMVLTDHDTVGGVAAFLDAARRAGIAAVSGVELSTRFEFAEIHLLGYGVDIEDKALLAGLSRIQSSRAERNARILARLADMGFPLDEAEVWSLAGDADVVGRPHIAEAMRRRGYVADVREAFDRFIGDNGPAYVARERVESVEGIRLLRAAGGVVVWAHPRIGFSSASFRKILDQLIPAGLDGVEVYHTNHSDSKTADVRAAARERGLLQTGGSDYHGRYKPDVELGRGQGGLRVPNECWEKLLERIGKRRQDT